MKFIIRDDDLNYFSKPADIEVWYKEIFAQNIPVGFSTIPFVKAYSDVYVKPNESTDREYPISENKDLVEYVKSNTFMEVLQHGCTHETKNGVYEYAKNEGLFGDTKRGKEELEKAFGKKVNIFVPPHDWISSHGIKAVEAQNMNIILGRSSGLRNFIFRWQYLINLFRTGLHINSTRKFAYPYVLDFGKHKEICSYRLEDVDVFEGLEYIHQKNGVFVVVVHLHSYDQTKKEILKKLIDIGIEYGAEFVHPSRIFQK